MGNGHSTNRRAFWKIEYILPSSSAGFGWPDKKFKPFASIKDRQQFAYAVATVITDNGQLSLNDHEFHLLYSRTESNDLKASIVASKAGVLSAKIESPTGAPNKMEAFTLFRAEVEVKLESILAEVPAGSDRLRWPPVEFPISPASISEQPAGNSPVDQVPEEAPPAYDSSSSQSKKQT